MNTKAELRQKFLQIRRSLDQNTWREKSDLLCQNLKGIPIFQEAKTVLAYFAIRQEPELNSLFTTPKKWGFSRCVDNDLIWYQWQPGNPLQTGSYGILEPLADAPILTASEVDLILIPAVACDAQGYRLGYGGGFYDRMLSTPEWLNIPRIGLVFDFAYIPQLPVDYWDQPLHGVCTESQILFLNP